MFIMCQTGLWVVKSAVWYRSDLSAEVYELETHAGVTNANEDAAAARLKAQSSVFLSRKTFTGKLVFYLKKEAGTSSLSESWLAEGSDATWFFLRSLVFLSGVIQ